MATPIRFHATARGAHHRHGPGRGARSTVAALVAAVVSLGGVAVLATAAGALPTPPESNSITYYVDVDGTGTACSQSQPCAAIETAIADGENYSCETGADVQIEVGPGGFDEYGDEVAPPATYLDTDCNYPTTSPIFTIVGSPSGTTVYSNDASVGFLDDCADLVVDDIDFAGYDTAAIEDNCGTVTADNDTFSYVGTGVDLFPTSGSAVANVTESNFYDDYIGVYNDGGAASIDSSTLQYNDYGIDNAYGSFAATNSTFWDNDYAIENDALISSPSTISFSTIDQNYFGLDSATNSTTDVLGSIFADSYYDTCSGPGTIVDEGYNVDDEGDCGFSTSDGSVNNVNPNVGPLADNGGPTQTMAVLPGSVAYHLVPIADCPTTDQRGAARPGSSGGTTCDAGSYEYAPPVSLAFDTSPITGPTGATANNGPVTVEAFDANGFPAVSAHTMVLDLTTTAENGQFAESNGGGATDQVVIPAGQATGSFYFGDLHPTSFPITVAGWNGLTSLGSISQTETIVAGPPALLSQVAGDDQTVDVGQPFLTDLEVNVEDGTANPLDDTAVTFTVTSGNATFPGDLSTVTVDTDVDGDATAPILTGGTAPGAVTVTATVNSLTTTFDETLDVGPPTTLTVIAGSDQSATAGTSFNTDFETRLTDEYGNPISGTSVTYDVTAGSTNFSGPSSVTETTDGNGLSETGTPDAGDTAGTETVTASVPDTDVSATFSDVTVVAGEPDNISVVTGNNIKAVSGATFGTRLTTEVTDEFGNPVPDAVVVYDITNGSSRIDDTTTVDALTNASGETSETLVAGLRSGPQTITATVEGTGITLTFTSVVITPPALSVVVSPFALGKSALTSTLESQIKALATKINVYGETKVSLVGYCSITGKTGENLALSIARAKAVRSYLNSQLSNLGDSGVSITISGKGASDFLGGNGYLSANRRVVAAVS